jgi:hypothetical protein
LLGRLDGRPVKAIIVQIQLDFNKKRFFVEDFSFWYIVIVRTKQRGVQYDVKEYGGMAKKSY